MGNSISIAFRREESVSVALFSHWGGMELINHAKIYLKTLNSEIGAGGIERYCPLGRLEPESLIVDFIRYMSKGQERIADTYYLGKDGEDGDNSDNGHWEMDVKTSKATQIESEEAPP